MPLMSSNRSTIHGCCASEAAGFVHEPKHATDVVISEINVSVFICVRIEFDAKDSASRAQKQTKFAFCRGAACLSGMQSRKVVQAERKSKRSLRFCRGAACLSGGLPSAKCASRAQKRIGCILPRVRFVVLRTIVAVRRSENHIFPVFAFIS